MAKDIYTRVKNNNKELEKLNTLHKRAVTVLLRCKTFFPFDLFPNTLIIDHNKVDIIYRNFFFTSQTVSIQIAKINYVRVEASIFFSTLQIETLGMEQNPPPLQFMKNKEASTAQHLIFGLMSAEKHNIDLSNLTKKEIFDKLLDIGNAA